MLVIIEHNLPKRLQVRLEVTCRAHCVAVLISRTARTSTTAFLGGLSGKSLAVAKSFLVLVSNVAALGYVTSECTDIVPGLRDSGDRCTCIVHAECSAQGYRQPVNGMANVCVLVLCCDMYRDDEARLVNAC
jgi:hypothetical protein